MKILIIQPTGDKRGHFGIYTSNVCQRLARLGHEVHLFTNAVHPDLYLKERPLFTIVEWGNGRYESASFDAIKTTRPIYYVWGYLRNSFAILRAGLRFARGKRFDVVHILDTEYGTVALLTRLYGRGLPLALMVNAPNFAYSEFVGPFPIKLYKEVQKRLLGSLFGSRIRGINVLGEYHKRELQRQFNLPDSFPVEVIYDGANPPDETLSKTDARKRIGVQYGGPLFLFFGMLRKDKGIECLLEAVSLARDAEFRLLIAGSPFDYTKEEMILLVERFGVADKVELRCDYIDGKDMYHYFFASDALILPYIKLYRGGSGPLLKEAAICKVPAIVSDVSEMGPLVKKHDMGLVAEPENPASLAQAMKAFLDLPEARKEEMGARAFTAANTWERMAKQYEAFYEKI